MPRQGPARRAIGRLSRRFTDRNAAFVETKRVESAPPRRGRPVVARFRKRRGSGLDGRPRRVGPVPMTTTERPAAARAVGRPSTSAPFEERLAQWVADDATLATAELLRRAREQGYRGGKSAFYDLARRLRRPAQRPLARPEAAPGVYSRHALVRVVVDLEGTRGAALDFLASQLAWSGLIHVELATGPGEDALLKCLHSTFAVFGGTPLATVWSGPRWLAQRDEDGSVQWAPGLGAVALSGGFALLVDDAVDGARGAAVLGAAVRRRFFKSRRFHDRRDAERQLAAWLAEDNAPRLPALGEERARLRPVTGMAQSVG